VFDPVLPVPAAPPATSGLLRSGITPDDQARWTDGIAWRSERCVQARGFDPCGTEYEDPPAGTLANSINYYRPVGFRVEDSCTTRTRDQGESRVRRQAIAVTSFMMARELQTGALSDENPYETPESGGVADQVNARLASPDTIVEAGTWDPLAGLGRLEELAREGALGQDPFIHVPVTVVPLIDGYLRRDGQLLFSKTGATVVADSGYDNIGPDGSPAVGGTWIYATGPVQVRTTDVATNEFMDHRTNTVLWTGERLFAATFDACNVHALVIETPATT
jgi:hypothetical protein